MIVVAMTEVIMRFAEIVNRLTGFSTPIFGISWNPPEPEIMKAKRIVVFLEDRRVLYSPSEMEVPDHCIQSILEIRRFLTAELGNIDTDSRLAVTVRALRATCRKFLDEVQSNYDIFVQFGAHHGHGF
jgi:hypothetical protein